MPKAFSTSLLKVVQRLNMCIMLSVEQSYICLTLHKRRMFFNEIVRVGF